MATPEPQEPQRPEVDAWGLPIVHGDPPPLDDELGVTTDGDGWATNPASTTAPVTRTVFVVALAGAGLSKLKYTAIKRGWHRRKHL